MKKIIITLGIALFAIGSYAQNDTLEVKSDYQIKKEQRKVQTVFGNNNRPLGFFLGTSFGYSPIGGNDALIGGASCGLIIGQHLGLGIIGKGFATDVNSSVPRDGNIHYYYSGGYGGFLVEPILFPKKAIHVSFPIIMGLGTVGYYWEQYDISNEYWKDGYDYNVFFMALEPGVEAEMNLTQYLRMSLGGSYRITTASDLGSNNAKDLNGMNIYFRLKLGIF